MALSLLVKSADATVLILTSWHLIRSALAKCSELIGLGNRSPFATPDHERRVESGDVSLGIELDVDGGSLL